MSDPSKENKLVTLERIEQAITNLRKGKKKLSISAIEYGIHFVPLLQSFVPPFADECTGNCIRLYHMETSCILNGHATSA